MATFSKLPLSESVNGKGILVSASATPGTPIHTSASGSAFDEVWIYSSNSSSADAGLTVEFGGTDAKDLVELNIPSQEGLILVIPGLFLSNSSEIKCFASTEDVLSIHGYINRVS